MSHVYLFYFVYGLVLAQSSLDSLFFDFISEMKLQKLASTQNLKFLSLQLPFFSSWFASSVSSIETERSIKIFIYSTDI